MVSHDPDFIRELFAGFGPVTLRRMFGAAGIFADGLMIGLVSNGTIYLRATSEDLSHFKDEGMTPFTYDTAKGPRTIASFWRMPERLYDDPDELVVWARRSREAVLRIKEKSGTGKSAGALSRATKPAKDIDANSKTSRRGRRSSRE